VSSQASPNFCVGLRLNYYLSALYRAEFSAVPLQTAGNGFCNDGIVTEGQNKKKIKP